MNEKTVLAAGGAVIILMIVALLMVRSYPAVQGTPSVLPGLATDLYPLYTDAAWGPVHAADIAGLTGVEATSSPVAGIMNIAEVTQPFETYYRDKLTAAGWSIDISREAGGPGGLVEAYQKGSEHILFGFTTVFHGGGKDEPVQCPCDTSFFVFSTGQTPL